jgi:hypothetical protein
MVWTMERRCLCQRCAGVLAHIMHALLPVLRRRCRMGIFAPSCWRHCPCLPPVTTSIANWCLPSPNAIMTRHLHLHFADASAGIALVFLPASRWRHCSIALSFLPALCRRCCHPCRAGISPLCTGGFALIAPPIAASILNWRLPSPVACNMSAYVVLLPPHHHCQWLCCCPRHHSTATWPLMVQPMQHWHFCQRCTGVLARMLLESLGVLPRCCCWRCAGIVALATWVFLPLSCWHC